MREVKPCKYCGDVNPTHWPFQCFQNPKRRKSVRIDPIGKVAKQMKKVRQLWFAKNPPDDNGLYHCYLNISPFCPGQLLPIYTTLDHVYPRASNPDKRYELSNLMPCCFYCNSLKGSKSLAQALKLKDSYSSLDSPANANAKVGE